MAQTRMTDEDFVAALYAGLLGRQPDPGGMAQHLDALGARRDDPTRYARLAAAFAASPEFLITRHLRSNVSGHSLFLPDMSGVTFEHAVSLGNFCHAAMALKQAGLRKFASPFDWLFSCPDMVAQCIEDDFASLLDRSQYEAVPPEARQTPGANLCHHVGYRQRFGLQFVFNHHLPLDDKDHAYFQRGADRLRKVLDSAPWKLFVMVSPVSVTLPQIERLLAALEAASSNFVLLTLHFRVANAETEHPSLETLKTVRLRHDVLAVELRVAQPSNGVTFPSAHDNLLLDRLLKSFAFRTNPGVG